MHLSIKILQTGITERSTVDINVEPSQKIIDIKNFLSQVLRHTTSSMRLVIIKDFAEILLTDDETVDSYSITSDSKLILDVFSDVSQQESEVYEKFKDEYELNSSPLPQKDWFGLIVEKVKIGSLTGMLQLIGEYEKENSGKVIDNEDDIFFSYDHKGWTLMHFACYYGHSNIVQLLVARQALTNKENDDELTPLMMACMQGHTECVRSILKHSRLQINKMTESENSALHKACKQGSALIVQLLIENGASMVLEDQNLMIPLQYSNSKEIFEMIPKYMGEIELQKSRGDFKSMCSEIIEGEIYFTGPLVIHDKLLFGILDTENGFFQCFLDKNDYEKSGRPLIYIKLIDIYDVKYSIGLPFGNKDAECFTIFSKEGNFKFYSFDRDRIDEWIDGILDGIEYCQLNRVGYSSSHSFLCYQSEIKPELCRIGDIDANQIINFKSFTVLDEIGRGSFGKVYKIIKNDSRQVFALKQLNKDFLIKQKQLKYAIGECKILSYLTHPFIIKMNYAFQTPKNLYMVLDYCPNGDLMVHLSEKSRFSETVAKFYISEIILAIEYLHSLDIVYRDLKPENILLDRAGHIRLADFGLAKENVNIMNPAMSFCGSPAYLAPELLSKNGSEKAADVYGVGAILYEMLSGAPPYYSDNIKELFRNIKRGMLQFSKIIKTDAQDLMKQLMNKDPKKRPKLTTVKNHSFFKDINWEELEKKNLRPPRLGSKWVQIDDSPEIIDNVSKSRVVDDEDYVDEDFESNEKVADFNFSRSSPSYIG